MRAVRVALVLGVLALLAGRSPASAALGPQVTWHGTQIHLYDALHAGYDGHGVVVAVLDGWIDRTHPDFGGRALQGADCSSGQCTPTMGKDHCGSDHGTHVAGTVASSSYGVAPRATVLPVRVLRTDGSGDCAGSPDAVAAGIRWAVSHGAQVLNLSLGADTPGSTTSSAIPDAVREAAAAGVVVVFSAGNADLPVADSYGSDALVVAATGPTGRLASYSQHGQGVSVAAPGGQPDSHNRCSQPTCITSLYPGDRYAVAAGTSMAAPHVAGLAALLVEQGRDRSAVMARITGTAHPLAGAGAGLVDAAAALGVPLHKTVVAPRPVHHATVRRPSASAPPRHAVVRAAVRPSPLATVPPAPTASPSPDARPAPVAAAQPPVTRHDTVPLPLAALAGALVGLAGTGVLVLPRLR